MMLQFGLEMSRTTNNNTLTLEIHKFKRNKKYINNKNRSMQTFAKRSMLRTEATCNYDDL